MKRWIPSLLLVASLVLGAGAASAETAFQFAAPNANRPNDPHVDGIRFSVIHGRNQSMRGLDLGLISMSETSRMSGVAFVAGVHRVNQEMSGGAAFSIVNYHRGTDTGFNGAFVNLVHDTPRAVNVSYFNIATGATLVDVGGVNVSQRSEVQIGFVNITQRLEGFQFGFLNVAPNGFLPVFPIFNFPVD